MPSPPPKPTMTPEQREHTYPFQLVKALNDGDEDTILAEYDKLQTRIDELLAELNAESAARQQAEREAANWQELYERERAASGGWEQIAGERLERVENAERERNEARKTLEEIAQTAYQLEQEPDGNHHSVPSRTANELVVIAQSALARSQTTP